MEEHRKERALQKIAAEEARLREHQVAMAEQAQEVCPLPPRRGVERVWMSTLNESTRNRPSPRVGGGTKATDPKRPSTSHPLLSR